MRQLLVALAVQLAFLEGMIGRPTFVTNFVRHCSYYCFSTLVGCMTLFTAFEAHCMAKSVALKFLVPTISRNLCIFGPTVFLGHLRFLTSPLVVVVDLVDHDGASLFVG